MISNRIPILHAALNILIIRILLLGAIISRVARFLSRECNAICIMIIRLGLAENYTHESVRAQWQFAGNIYVVSCTMRAFYQGERCISRL